MRQWGFVGVVALGTALWGLAAALLAVLVGLAPPLVSWYSTPNVDTLVGVAVAWRTILVTAGLVGCVFVATRLQLRRAAVASVRRGVLLGLALGYLLTPFAWSGNAYASQGWWEPGVLTVLADAALWMAVGAGTLWLAARSGAPHPTRPLRERASVR